MLVLYFFGRFRRIYQLRTSNFGIALSLDLVEDIKTVLNEFGSVWQLVTSCVSNDPTASNKGQKSYRQDSQLTSRPEFFPPLAGFSLAGFAFPSLGRTGKSLAAAPSAGFAAGT